VPDWGAIGSVWYWRVFVATFLLIAAWETWRPRGLLLMPAPRRWAGNLGIYIGWVVFSFALAGVGPFAVALSVQSSNFGPLNRNWLPFSVRFLAGFLLLDLTNYWTHRLEHLISPLWRLHQVHHADPDCDVTTGLRSHPFEFLFTQAGLVLVVAATALPAASAMAYAFVNLLASFATHANGRLPQWADRSLRSVLISPDTHHAHHSIEPEFQQGNYGVILSIWDRAFGTWIEPSHNTDRFGLEEVAPERAINAWQMLTHPFRPPQLSAPARPDIGRAVENIR